jgi:hypothetical protein
MMLRSARGEPLAFCTRVCTDAVVVKFCADFVPVTEAVLFSVVPLAAVTMPRMVIVAEPPPGIVPMLHVTPFH